MSIERINNDESNQALIEKLRAIIEIESSKPISEQDIDLIDECVDYLMELENGIELTDEEIENGKKQIYMLLDKNKQPQKKLKFKGLLIAACLAILILLANLVALACGVDTVSILKEWGHTIVEMFEGEKKTYENLTVIKEGELVSFSSISDFYDDMALNVLYPSKLPDETVLTGINVTGSYDSKMNYSSEYIRIIYVTNNPQISITINTNPNFSTEYVNSPNFTVETINEINCYFDESLNDCAQCYAVIDGYTYVIKASNHSQIDLIISNLKENVI